MSLSRLAGVAAGFGVVLAGFFLIRDPFAAFAAKAGGTAILLLATGSRLALLAEAYCHEACHGLAALLLEGRFRAFAISWSGRGICLTGGERSRGVVLAAGYLGVILAGILALAASPWPARQVPAAVLLLALFAFPLFRAATLLTLLVGLAVSGGLLAAVVLLDPGEALGTFLRCLGVALLVAGFHALLQLLWLSLPGRVAKESDAARLGELLGVHPFLVSLSGLVLAGGLCLGSLAVLKAFMN